MPPGINRLSTPLSPQLLVPVQIKLLKDTVANHPPSDCPDSPRCRHHFPVVLRSRFFEQCFPIPLCTKHDCMFSGLASSPAVASRVVEPWDPPLIKERS